MYKKLFAIVLGLALCLAAFAQAEDSALGYVAEMDKDTIMSVAISVDPEEWQAMLDSAQEKEYIPADITINGVTIENVGIRPKGNSSLSDVARNDDTDRYSFKIKFNEFVKGQTWMGLDKLALNNNFSDATYMKEYLSYDIMSAIGVDTPLYAYADIAVNGDAWGFYLAVEDVDGSYLERVKNDEGELYKPETMDGMMGGGPDGEGWDANREGGDFPGFPMGGEGQGDFGGPQAAPNFPMGGSGGFGGMRGNDASALIYIDDDEESYAVIFDNEKTKTTSEDHQRVIEAIKNVNEGTELETYVDVDQMLRYIAGHTVVVNLDSYSGMMTHNYLLYEHDGQISMVPWDYNMAWGGFQSGSATDVVNSPIDTPVTGASMEDRPMFSKLLEAPEYMAQYHEYMQQIIDTYFADGGFAAKVEALDAMIASYVEQDPSAFYPYEEYQAAIEALKALGTLRGESIQGQLDGSIPATTDGQAAEPDKLVDASDIDIQVLGSMGGHGSFGGGDRFGGDMDTMRQAMRILQGAEGGELSAEQRQQLEELGLTEEEIQQMQSFPR